MRKGINIKITKSKKKYRAPILQEITLDRDIILMASSEMGEPWGLSSFESFSSTSSTEQIEQKSAIFPESENPFGGGKPDYQ